MLATLALLVCQDQSQVSQSYRSPAFSFPLPDPSIAVSEAANGQVYFVELRLAGQDASAPFLKLFSVPNQQGAVDAAALFGLGAQEFGNLANAAGLTGGLVTEGSLTTRAGPAAFRAQDYAGADGTTAARSRIVLLQNTPMAAGAMIWLAPGQPDHLLTMAEGLVAGVRVLPFDDDALQFRERHGVRYAVPLLWLRQELDRDGSYSINCQGPIGTVSVATGANSIFTGALGESVILDSQPSEAETVARNFGGSVIRQNALMSLTDKQLHVGQRYLLQLADGSQAEIRNAIFSNESVELCFLAALYATGNRPAMVAWMDRMLAEVAMPWPTIQQVEERSWSGITVRFPQRLEVEEREPESFLSGGWTFTIPHDKRPDTHSFELRVEREDLPATPVVVSRELRSMVDGLVAGWSGAAIESSSETAGAAFGQPAAVLQAAVLQNGVAFVVDARRVATAEGVFRSLAFFPADLQKEHRPVLDFVLERSSLWQSGQALTTTHGAKIRLSDSKLRLRDFQSDGRRCYSVKSLEGVNIVCQPRPELNPLHDLTEALALQYFDGNLVVERLDVQLSGGAVPAVLTHFVFEDEGREVTELQFHALYLAGGEVWELRASGPAARRLLILEALTGIELPVR